MPVIMSPIPLGDWLRTFLNYRPPVTIHPFSSKETLSEIFPWREDETWQSRFEISNVPSLIFPDEALSDQVTVIAFCADGSEIAHHEMNLAPFETWPYLLADLVGDDNYTVGTFSVFHHLPQAEARLGEKGIFMAERGYVSFKRREDALREFIHGNLLSLSKVSGQSTLGFFHGCRTRTEPYRLQLDMSDCRSFELTFTNPLPKPQQIQLMYLPKTRS